MEIKNCEVMFLLVNNLGFFYKNNQYSIYKIESLKCNVCLKLIIDFCVIIIGFFL